MEFTLPPIIIPAIVALMFKAGIYAYAYHSHVRNAHTRIYLLFLFSLSLQNLGEIFGLYKLNVHGVLSSFEATVFYASSIFVIALLFQLSMSLAFGELQETKKRLVQFVHAYATVLVALLIFTPLLIRDYEVFHYSFGLSITRIPGPLFPMFSLYALAILFSCIGILIYGSRKQETAPKRARNAILLAAIIPMVAAVAVVLTLLQLGIKWINASVVFPTCITYFLIVTAYATHQHRIFDIQFYIPWSKVRQRKTAFYDRIRSMIAEVADLGSGSINHAVDRLADTLRCPVAFVDDSKLVLAAAGAPQMTKLPLSALRNIDHIVVANEVAQAHPDIHAMMKQHGVAAIVPFYPHSKSAASWLLLGDSFSENVYTPLDFRMVEELFDKMAELFLDKLMSMRMQLAEAQLQITTLKTQLQTAESNLSQVQRKVDTLAQENARLQREQPADSLIATERAAVPFTLTLLGRDKQTLRRLRSQFSQAEYYAGADSSSFRRQPIPDVLIVRLEPDTDSNQRRVLQVLTESHRRCAMLLYGPRAAAFVADNRRQLVGLVAEVLPEHFTDEILARKVSALAELRRCIEQVTDPDRPLLGHSIVFKECLAEAKRLSGFKDPAFIKSEDLEEAVALGNYMHEASGATGAFAVLRTARTDTEDAQHLETLLDSTRHGTLMIDNIGALSNEMWERLLVQSNQFADCRLIVGSSAADAQQDPAMLLRPLRPFVLEMPTLRERRTDIGPLVHYFTLQFNLQSGTERYLTQAEVDDLLTADYPKDLLALKSSVFVRLMAKEKRDVAAPEIEVSANGRTLDECVTEFEARLIADTLKRCGGNKSKAARLLGMRPNTLHYKLERYGLLDKQA